MARNAPNKRRTVVSDVLALWRYMVPVAEIARRLNMSESDVRYTIATKELPRKK